MAVEPGRNWQRYDTRDRIKRLAIAVLAAATVLSSWLWLDLDLQYVASSPPELLDLAVRMYPPEWAYAPDIVMPLIETIHIAVVGTILAVVLSIPVAFLAARNTTPNRVTYAVGKLIVTVSRSVHTIIWAMLFVVMFGPGAFAGMVAIGVRSIGFVGKLLGEEIEEIAFDQVEAIDATGASTFQVLLYGVIPQIKPALVGISVYRWDINVRGATILGVVGAGGIGVQLFDAVDAFQWSTVALILIAILGIVLLSETVSARARAMVR
ncbi:phosphonate ABC transporter, permease protein PhnE [Salinadaptatus halalkaliphilus]|uniref:Phosphonate ABC transporter, permease protein PhnE n=1 Tax=Salinadaptatus halalkaliphilus TaxID=2419781 RepID=A0A4S3TJ02_9EURY|nr:phosphonate ABC transporter, permease protein PhnE [Salinadaptatus halalkaliphilus]THE63193.1 phosphonate ABC transporter, permease protein PhnE [Salinadaptatus halalkaliphilus]